MAATPLRNVRVPDEVWAAARTAAAARDVTVSEVIVNALRQFVDDHDTAQRFDAAHGPR